MYPQRHSNSLKHAAVATRSMSLLATMLGAVLGTAATHAATPAAAAAKTRRPAAKTEQLQPACMQQPLVGLNAKRFVEEDLGAAANEYVSYAIYYWPNPKDPAGCYILRDGQKNPELIKQGNAPELNLMLATLQALLEHYQKSGNEQYAQRAAEWLKLWFIDEKTRMQPHLKYAQLRAQARPAQAGRQGGIWALESQGGGIIDMSNLAHVLKLLPALKKSRALDARQWQALDGWMESYLRWLLESPQGKYAAASKNNHYLHYCYQLVELCLYLQRPQQAREVLQQCFARMDAYIAADGSQPQELRRKKDWDYSIYALRGWINLAAAGERCQLDMWNYPRTCRFTAAGAEEARSRNATGAG